MNTCRLDGLTSWYVLWLVPGGNRRWDHDDQKSSFPGTTIDEIEGL